MRCMSNSAIRRIVAQRLARFVRRIWGAFAVTRCRSSLSLPDPAANGMLAGTLAQSKWGRRLGVRINFTGENDIRVEVRVRPYRIVKAMVLLLLGL